MIWVTSVSSGQMIFFWDSSSGIITSSIESSFFCLLISSSAAGVNAIIVLFSCSVCFLFSIWLVCSSKPGMSVFSDSGITFSDSVFLESLSFSRIFSAFAKNPCFLVFGFSIESEILYSSVVSLSSIVRETRVIVVLLWLPVSESLIFAESLLFSSIETENEISGSPFGCATRFSIWRESTYSASSIEQLFERYKSTIIFVWLLWAVVKSNCFSELENSSKTG